MLITTTATTGILAFGATLIIVIPNAYRPSENK